MLKCQHGNKIAMFCISQKCESSSVSGCLQCMSSKHNHNGSNSFVNENQINELIKKFNVDPIIKPKCRYLQQTILKYSQQLKKDFQIFVDNVCIDIMNEIGHPYLADKQMFSSYKRVKKQDYSKVNPRDFRAFFKLAQDLDKNKFNEQQKNLYNLQLQQKLSHINMLENVMKSIQQVIQKGPSRYSFAHDPKYFTAISETINSVLKNSGSPLKAERKYFHSKENSKEKIEKKEDSVPHHKEPLNNNPYEKAKDSLQKRESARKDASLFGKERKRPESIDKRYVHSNKLQLFKKQYEESKNSNQEPKEDIKAESSPRRRYLEAKQTEISDKKQKLKDLLKNKEESPNRFKNLSMIRDHIKMTENQVQGTPAFSESGSQEINKEENLYLGIANLPVQEDKKQSKAHQLITKRTIVIPFDDEDLKNAESQSPIHRNIQKLKEFSEKSPRKKISLERRQEQKISNLTENEEKSIYLMLEALKLKPTQAIVLLKKSLEYCSENLSSAEYLSYLYLETNQPKQALNLCNRTLSKLENSVEKNMDWHININKSAALNLLGRYSQAIACIEEPLQEKESEKIYKILGDSYFSLGLIQKSITNYQKATQLDQQFDEAHYNLAAAYFTIENYHNAKFQIMKAIQLAPQEQIYQTFKKELLERMKQY